MFGKVEWVGGKRQTSADENAGQKQIPVATMRIDAHNNWIDDPLDVSQHSCGLQPCEQINMRAIRPPEIPLLLASPKRQRLPSNEYKTFSPSISFGKVSWTRSKFNGLIPYIALPNQEEPLRFVVSKRRTDSSMGVKCNRCVIRTVRNRKAGVKGMPMFLFSIKDNQWVHRNPFSPTFHCCGFNVSKEPSPVEKRSIHKSVTSFPVQSSPVQPKPKCSRKGLLNKSLSPSTMPTFGEVFWMVGKRGGQIAYVPVPGQEEPARFCVSAVNKGPQALTILKCSWCLTIIGRKSRRGGILKSTNFKVLNNQWVYSNPLDLKSHCCRLNVPILLFHKQKITKNVPSMVDELVEVESGIELSLIGRRDPPCPSKKGDFGEVEWLFHSKSESYLAVAHLHGQQLSFCIAHRTYSTLGVTAGTCIVNCLECKLVNQQRIKAGVAPHPLPQLKIVNSRWKGQHPFYPIIPHFCDLSQASTTSEEDPARRSEERQKNLEEEEVEVVGEEVHTPQPPISNINTSVTMARPKSAIRKPLVRKSREGKENSGSVPRDREPRSAAQNAMNALLTLSLNNRRNRKTRSILQEKHNIDVNTPIRSYKLVLQQNDYQDEESEVKTFDTNELHNLCIENSADDRLLKDQGFSDNSVVCISDDDDMQETEVVRELPSRKCKHTSTEQRTRTGSSSSLGFNFFLRDTSANTSPTDSFFSAVGESAEAMLQGTSSTEEVEEEEDEELNADEINRQNGIYEVDKVLAVRHNAGREMEYLLKWKNYAYTVSTWEKSQFVQECKELILEFTKRERLREIVANSMKANERPLYRQGHAASAFFSLQRWEDEMNEVLVANGQAPLMVENWVDTYGRPKNFKFITANILTPGALAIMEHPKIVPCFCLQGCVSSKECCPDVVCYASNSRIRKNFNFEQDWLVECSNECACGIDCQTKVVQRGRRIPIIIFRTFDRGWSVRTAQKIPNNTFVMEYVGEVVTMAESKFIKSATYQFDMDACGADKCAFVVDAMHNGNEARFVNHSCDPNMIVRGVFCDRLDNRYLRLAFFAIKDIERGEEITINYFSKMDNHTYAKKTKNRTQKSCFCKAKNCRGYII